MKWLNKLDRKYGHLGIHNLISYIVFGKVIVYIIALNDRTGGILNKFVLDPSKVMHGEVWRVLSFAFYPPQLSPLFVFFAFYLMYIFGQGLEREWGTFRFNIYYFMGWIGTIIAAFITGHPTYIFYLDQTIFLAFACIYPTFTLRLFFVLPVQIKYLAILNGIFIGYSLMRGTMTDWIVAVFVFGNFLLFFWSDIIQLFKTEKRVRQNRSRYRTNVKAYKQDRIIHKCVVCGITEKDNPDMDFRYLGDDEYCMPHLEEAKQKQTNE